MKTTKKRPGPSVSQDLKELLNMSLRDDLIITPVLNEFMENWDETFSEPVADRMAKLLKTPQRDRSGSWSASAAGMCWRRQELQFLGAPVSGTVDTRLGQIFQNGRWVHLKHQAILLEAGILDNIEVTVKKPSKRARCTMDGEGVAKIGRWAGREFGFELKGRNDWTYNTQVMKGVDDKTRLQVDFEFLLSGLDLFVIMNENKNNQAMKEWVFVRDTDRVREMAKQINELNAAIDRQRLHPMLDECKKQLKSGEFYNCPFGGPGGVCFNTGTWFSGRN